MGTEARGSGGGRFQQMVDAVADEGAGQDALVAALMELCEALSFCTEDGVRYFPTEAAARALVQRAGSGDGTGATPDMILLSVRAITYLCDAMPRGADVDHHGLLLVLCSRLLAIEYLDVAEQCLQAFEKISQGQPTQCLQAGMINAVRIDFFTASIQDCSVSCRKCLQEGPSRLLPESQFVLDLVPTLCNLLQSEPRQSVEKVAACLISIVESFSTSVDLVDQLCHQGVIEKVLPLIHTSGLMALSPSTCIMQRLACTQNCCQGVNAVCTVSSLEPGIGEERQGVEPRRQHGQDLAGEPVGGHVERPHRALRQCRDGAGEQVFVQG